MQTSLEQQLRTILSELDSLRIFNNNHSKNTNKIRNVIVEVEKYHKINKSTPTEFINYLEKMEFDEYFVELIKLIYKQILYKYNIPLSEDSIFENSCLECELRLSPTRHEKCYKCIYFHILKHPFDRDRLGFEDYSKTKLEK